MVLELLYTLLFLALLIGIIYKSPFFQLDGFSKKYSIAAFSIKVLFSLLLWAIYTFYYTNRSTSDIFKYFDDGKLLHELFSSSPLNFFSTLFGVNRDNPEIIAHLEKLNFWYKKHDYGIFNDNRTIIRFNALVSTFSLGYYHIHAITMCFLSFSGLVAVYKVFSKQLHNKLKELYFALFLLPSVLFWGSGVLKEGLLIFALGFLIYNFFQAINEKFTLIRIFNIFLFLGLLFITKVYLLLMIIPGLIFVLAVKYIGTKNLIVKFIFIHAILILFALNWKVIFRLPVKQLSGTEVVTGKSLDLLNMLKYKQKDFIHEAKIEKAGSFIQLQPLDNTFTSVVKNAPQALGNVLFRPHLLDSKSPVVALAAIENLLFIILIACSIFFFKKPNSETQVLISFSVSFVILLALLVGLVVPVLGAIVRYKVPMLPFYAIICICLIDKEKLLLRFPFLNKFIN